ncbi:hypothetical protein ACFQFC_22845 [Amorphoplanes digitatis]|uniref:hypothetical protein n=1 Tax=Actinoplanes digitatis TaxID=1868 RepID=UPI003607A85A
MKRAWPRRGLIAGLALTLGVTGLTVVTAGAAAVAAPHYDRPPSVQIGWNDSATPGKAYEAAEEHFPLGTWVDDAGKSHTSRVYATFDLSGFEGKTVYGGSVFIREQSAADCTKRAIEIWRTKPVGATPTWRKTPDPIAKLDEILTPEYCPGASISFEVGAAVKDAVAHKQRRITFELRVPAQFESDAAYGRRLNWYNTVQLSMQYNSAPKIDSDHLYNGGFACTQLKPPPRLGGFANVLQALATDADENDAHSLTTEFAVWPREDPEARSVHTQEHGTSGRVNTVNLPEGVLVDGKTYGWQARVGDGAELSAWSKKCFFTYDRTRPSTPVVTSANYPVDGAAPPGVPAVFTFSGHGDKDVAGFQYSWNGLGVNSCGGGGDLGELVCRDPLTLPGTIRANAPGGTATVTINPTGSGPQRLTVRSIDQAGNVSPETQYETFVPWSAPEVRVEGGKPEWNQDVLLKSLPQAG